MTISKWVHLTFVGIFLIAFVVLDKSLFWAWEVFDQANISVLGRYITLTRLLAMIGGVGFTFWFYRKEGVFAYMSEVVAELKKVQWPSMDETKRSTVVVIAFTILLSAFLAFFDWIWKYLTDFIFITGA